MTHDQKEIFDDLYAIINKIVDMEKKAGEQVISYETLDHISYAMESLSGNRGVTEGIKQKRQEELALLNKANN